MDKCFKIGYKKILNILNTIQIAVIYFARNFEMDYSKYIFMTWDVEIYSWLKAKARCELRCFRFYRKFECRFNENLF